MRLRISAIALVLTAGAALAEGAPEVSTDLSVTLKPQQYRICNDRPARPAWMDELHPRQAYKALTMMDRYELRAWEQIAETKDCSCETRFPEWEEAEKEYQKRFDALPQPDHTALRLEWVEKHKALEADVRHTCEEQGNW